nr:transporter [uncultured Roseateles sp.]
MKSPLRSAAPWPLLLALCASCPTVWADEAISTDRPDFVESSDVVGKGRYQIETGLGFERNKDAGLKTRTTTTPTLLRVGIDEAWEFRVETDGYTRLRAQDLTSGAVARERGMSDLALGLKWHTQDGDAATGKPGTAWLFHADLNSGSQAFRGQGVRPSVRFVAEWELADEWSVGVMPGLLLDKNGDGKRFTSGILAVTVGKGWTEKLHSFVELAAQQITSSRNGGSVLTFDIGGAYTLTNDVQLDVALSRGLNKYTPDLAWTVGLSVRF